VLEPTRDRSSLPITVTAVVHGAEELLMRSIAMAIATLELGATTGNDARHAPDQGHPQTLVLRRVRQQHLNVLQQIQAVLLLLFELIYDALNAGLSKKVTVRWANNGSSMVAPLRPCA
jgi:hypothetical protein